MYAVTCSSESTAKPYLLDIAPETDHVLKLGDYKTLKVIKTAIQNQQCLSECLKFNSSKRMNIANDMIRVNTLTRANINTATCL